ncbi:sensor histidine kinase [Massilia sp. 9096]|uniref:sensor histidine kinase n=1 Tax=Massilia sp. 9096 TaxID=1500894 RepID=UPI00056A0BCA|nr:histidine kinase [Massilia sp. 9096]
MRSWRAALLYLLAWLMLGLLLAAMLAVGGAAWPASLLFALPLVLVYAFASGYSAYYVCRAYPLGPGRALAVLRGVGLTSLCAAGLWCALGAAWSSLWQALAPTLSLPLNRTLAASTFGIGVLLYGLAAAVSYLLIESARVRELETRTLQVKLMAQDAELRMLRTQVDPHFLFNSLNSISALTTIDPAAARAMIVQLADFFRHSLGLQADRKVTLAQELRLVADFVAIEQVRFGERLRVGFDADAGAQACLLPPMLLQPLVENAVKHGIGQMLEPGMIRVHAARAGTQLQIRVENDADPDGVPAKGGGIGLENVRQRLAATYGHEAGLRWTRTADAFCVELTLPAEMLTPSTDTVIKV